MSKRILILALLLGLLGTGGCGWMKRTWNRSTGWVTSLFTSSKTAPAPQAPAKKKRAPALVKGDGETLLARGQYLAATDAFTRRLAAGVSDPGTRVRLLQGRARALYHLNEDYRALADAYEAITLAPRQARLYDLRLMIWARQGQMDKAIKDADRLTELAPRSAVAWFNRALIRVKLGQPRPALDDLKRAIRLDPRLAEAHHLQGVILLQQKRNRPAERALRRAMELALQNPDYRLDHGIAAYQLGRLGEALADATRALKMSPQMARGYYNRGMIYFRLGKRELAKQDFARFMAMTGIEVVPKAPAGATRPAGPGTSGLRLLAPGQMRLPDLLHRPGR